jgi:hypothetical protein
MNMEIHNFNTKYNTNLHSPISNLTKFQKGAYYSGTKIFSHLPANIICPTNDVERFTYCPNKVSNSIYTLEEFFNYNR